MGQQRRLISLPPGRHQTPYTRPKPTLRQLSFASNLTNRTTHICPHLPTTEEMNTPQPIGAVAQTLVPVTLTTLIPSNSPPKLRGTIPKGLAPPSAPPPADKLAYSRRRVYDLDQLRQKGCNVLDSK